MKKALSILAAASFGILAMAEPDDLATEAYAHFEATNEVHKAVTPLDAKIDGVSVTNRNFTVEKMDEAKAYAHSQATNALAEANAYTDQTAESLVEDVTNVVVATIADKVGDVVTKEYIESLNIEVGINSNEVSKIATNVAYSITMDCPTDVTRNNHTATFVNTHNGETRNLFVLGQVNKTSGYAGLMTVEDKTALDDAIGIIENWESYLGGSNVVFAITNYMSGTYSKDYAKLRITELRDGQYNEIYDSRKEILVHITNETERCKKELLGEVAKTNEWVQGAIDLKADRAWGKYTSDGSDAPEDNVVYMTAPSTIFGAGNDFQRVSVGEGAIWVLADRGAPVYTAGDEGVFKFQDIGGTNYFGFAKSDSYMIGCDTDGITVQNSVVFLRYGINMATYPTIMYKTSLVDGEPWIALNDSSGNPIPGSPVTVQWDEGSTENEKVAMIAVGVRPSGFFTAQIEQAGGSKFFTNMEADFQGGLTCTNTALGVTGVIYPVFNGTAVEWQWRAR